MKIKYGGRSDLLIGKLDPFSQATIHEFSLHCTPLHLYDYHENEFAHTSAFIFKHKEKIYLISAWHSLSGRNFFTRSTASSGLIPKRFSIFPFYATELGGKVSMGREKYFFSLTQSQQEEIESPPIISGNPIDLIVAQLPFSGIKIGSNSISGLHKLEIGYHNYDSSFGRDLLVGSDIFVLGYPLETFEGMMTPIWKRGSIAAEPRFGIDPPGAFLIDVNSTSGMSGGPIVLRKSRGRIEGTTYRHEVQDTIIGVYSGRVLTGEESSRNSFTLAYGWSFAHVVYMIDNDLFIKLDLIQ